jgi:hypothetical protein
VFVWDPPAPAGPPAEAPETSITPLSSPRRTAQRLEESNSATPSTLASPTPAPAPTNTVSPPPAANRSQADQQLRALIAADVPSHRAAWKDDGSTWDVFVDISKQPTDQGSSIDDDQESIISEGSDSTLATMSYPLLSS